MQFSQFFETLPADNNQRGKTFEIASKWWLKNDDLWATYFQEVWLWNEYPERNGPDTGVDIVAKASNGEIWAIQCKAYSPETKLKKADIDSFLSSSNKRNFQRRMLITTTRQIGKNAREVLAGQERAVQIVDWNRLESSSLDWSKFKSSGNRDRARLRELRPHQVSAVQSVVNCLKKADRGQLIMACGTGKTLAGLRIQESLDGELFVVLVPSLTLVSQTLSDWLSDRARDFRWLAVCSDESVTKDPQDNSRLIDFDFPATTKDETIAEFLELKGRKVVFSTYHSSEILMRALKRRGLFADLVLFDEAHRLTGKVERSFSSFLSKDAPVHKKLFMTATPRIYSSQIKSMAKSMDLEVASMDDEETFGQIFFRYSFSEAIRDGILCDYRVVVVGVTDKQIKSFVNRRALVKAGLIETDSESLATHIAVAKATKEWNLRRLISFHSRVAKARKFASDHLAILDWLPDSVVPQGKYLAKTISSSMPTNQRRVILDNLRSIGSDSYFLVSNARCLTEGIDVPTLDGVVFVDPKTSQVDIVQAIGRAIRLGGQNSDKKFGVIVVPIFLQEGKKQDPNFEQTNFKKVGEVLTALRAHDPDFGEELDSLRVQLGSKGTFERQPEKIIWDVPSEISVEFAEHIRAVSIELASNSWNYMFGLLQRYLSINGHVRVPAKEVLGGELLGNWVVKQRTLFRKGQLSSDRVLQFEGLGPTWSWDPIDEDWNANFQKYLEAVAENGTSRFSRSGEPYAAIGHWLINQRENFRLGRLSQERISKLESSASDWSWNPLETSWDQKFDLLVKYEEERGNTNVPVTFIIDGERLGLWVRKQREYYNEKASRGSITPERVKRLESLKTWSWNPQDDFQEKLKMLHRYFAQFQTVRVPITAVFEDFPLGKWVSRKRQSYKKGNLLKEEIELLERSGPDWSWEVTRDSFSEFIEALKSFVQANGHARPPVGTIVSGKNLGSWVLNMRAKYRENALSAEKIRAIEGVHDTWTWSLMEEQWQEKFEELRTFFLQNGHSDVPYVRSGKGDNQLSEWIAGQRKSFKRGKMAPERKALLDSIEFRWEPRDPWEERFQDLLTFVAREGHSRVHWKHRENGQDLGKWISHQRDKFRKGLLTLEQIEKLQKLPGWDWAPSAKAGEKES